MGDNPITDSSTGANDWPLVGRSGEVRLLRDLLTAPTVRHVVLAGPPGVGKTRLAQEGMAVARRLGMEIAEAAATRSAAQIPFAAVAPVLHAAAPTGRAFHDRFDLLRRSGLEVEVLHVTLRPLLSVVSAQIHLEGEVFGGGDAAALGQDDGHVGREDEVLEAGQRLVGLRRIGIGHRPLDLGEDLGQDLGVLLQRRTDAPGVDQVPSQEDQKEGGQGEGPPLPLHGGAAIRSVPM